MAMTRNNFRFGNILVMIFLIINSYFFIEIPSQVKEEWVARYNGPGNSDDWARAIAVDTSGNVYVTGESAGSGTALDYAIIKYNNLGEEQWVARYNGPGNGADCAYGMVVDSSGNVFVTGRSTGSETSWDYATIKYNSDGVQQWVARYNGEKNVNDCACKIELDNWGNTYVTGYINFTDFLTYSECATIKYNSAGEEEWVAIYKGEENGKASTFYISLDSKANVYVAGYDESLESDSDFLLIKYSNSGTEKWVRKYNGEFNGDDRAFDLAVDGVGNIYVTGVSECNGTKYDYTTIKYDSNGNEKWISKHNGTENDYDFSRAIALDDIGNVYVTGYTNFYGFDDPDLDYTTIKYNNEGEEQWVAIYDGDMNYCDQAYAICVDGNRNVYVTGYCYLTQLTVNYVTIKYDTNGVIQWMANYNGGNGITDAAKDITVDDSGNVYVTGYSNGGETSWDFATIKYTQDVSINRYIWMNY